MSSNEPSAAAHPFAGDFATLTKHYSELLATHGDSPEAVQYRGVASHEYRFQILAEVAPDLRTSRVLDFGCGTARLLDFLKARHDFAGEYIGYDINPDMIAEARRKHPGVQFEVRDVLAQGIPESFDYVLINGVFNNKITDNWGFMTAVLPVLFAKTRRALAFNAITTYVDYFDEGLFYVEPETVFRFCKEQLSPCVDLRHDYQIKSGVLPFEYTTYVRQCGVAPRAAKAVTIS